MKVHENLKISQNDSLAPSPPAKIKILLKVAKNSWKTEIKPFLQCTIPHENQS